MSETPNYRKPSSLGLPLLLLLALALMLALRWKHTSFWYDEALTAYVATDSWNTLWRWVTQVDIQVPLHYILLRLWAGLVGDSEFALRAFSALCILLAVAGVYAAARRLVIPSLPRSRSRLEREGENAARRAGLQALALRARGWGEGLPLAAAVFAGFLPGVYWIAYEVRAYALALALFAWATAFLLRLLDRDLRPSSRTWLLFAAGYALLMAGALYTHYTALAGFAAHAALIAFAALRRVRRTGVRAALTLALPVVAAGLLFAPWLPVMLERGAADRSYFPGTVTPGQSLAVMASFRTLARQETPIPPETTLFVASYALLALIGALLGLLQRPGRRAALYASLLAAIPLALTVALLVANPKLTGRYFWPAWLGLDVLAGLAIAALVGWRRVPALALAGSLCAVPWLAGDLGAPPDSDYRALFAAICTEGQPGDVILLRDGTQFVVAAYYGKRPPCAAPRRTFGMPDAPITDVTRWLSLAETQTIMAEIAALKPPNIWIISWQADTMDPQALGFALLDGLGEHSTRLFGDVRLDRYANADSGKLAALARDGPLSHAEWFNLEPVQGGPRLVALRLFAPEVAHAGDVIVLQAWWERGAALQPDLRASARLTTLDFGWTYTQKDGPPAGWYFWDDRWPEDTPVQSRYELIVGPDVPPGKVAVRYVIYDAQGRIDPVVIVAGEITVAAE